MRLPLLFARRYLFSRKSTNAINIIGAVSITGMTVCAAAFILILSVFNGFEGLVLQMYGAFYPDMRIEAVEGKVFQANDSLLQRVQSVPGVRTVSQVLEDNALLVLDGRQQPATVRGVDELYRNVTGMDTSMASGDSFVVEHRGTPFIILGSGIDHALEARTMDPLGKVTLFVPRRGAGRSISPSGEFRRADLMVSDVFIIQDDFDQQYAFVPISLMRDLMRYDDEVSSLELALEPGRNQASVRKDLQQALGPTFRVLTRYQQNAFLYRIMAIERLAVYLILTFVLLIVAFNMVGSLSMVVIEKRKDIGILRAMGATSKTVRNIFLLEGLMQGVLGLLVGFGLAIAMVLAQQQFGLVPLTTSGTFIIQYYPVALKWVDFVAVTAIVLSIAALASWLPASRAAKQDHLAVVKE